jgi:hypothetical protein
MVLLPKRLARRVSSFEPPESAGAIAAGKDNWGLSDRIRVLPGVSTVHTVLDDGATATDHFIDPAYVLRTVCIGPQLLCHIDMEGILVPQLDAVDKAEVAFKGWASRAEDQSIIYLPRDSIEMEIVWKIILRAYQFLASRPPKFRAPRGSSLDLPKCVSTANYWM